MKLQRKILAMLVIGLALITMYCRPVRAEKWSGTDVTVVEEAATEAGREPSDPLINTDQGDILLFAFLMAGTVGGFVGGYYCRDLFSESSDTEKGES